MWIDIDLPKVRTRPEGGGLRLSEAFPRNPAPHHEAPTPEEIEAAKADFATHIPSLLHRGCLAPECDEEWPCPPRRNSGALLDRAGLIDVNGDLRRKS